MRELLRNLATMVAVSWQADRVRSIASLVSTVLVPITRSLQAVGFALIADGVVGGDTGRATAGTLVVAGLTAANRIVDWASVTVRMRLREHTILLLDSRVMSYVATAPGLEHHERPEHQDRLGMVEGERWALNNPFMPIAWTLGNVVLMVTVLGILGSLHPLLFLLPVAAAPSLVAGFRIERIQEDLRSRHAEPRRLLYELFRLATSAPAAKEVRVFGLAGELQRRHRATFEALDATERAADIRAALLAAGGWGCFAVGYMGAVGLVVNRSAAGDLSVGAVVLALSLGAQVHRQVSELVENFRWFTRTTHAVGRYRWLAEYAEEARAALTPADPAPVPRRLVCGIDFAGVRFTYPGTEKPVLHDLDLHLPAGATVAVVGENGAGKTTIAKLLLRHYEPTEGTITVDGVDLRRFDVDEWRSVASAASQDFARLQFLAQRSVGVGRLVDVDDRAAVLAALDRGAGADLVGRLPSGLDTQLGREFDGGVDLSVGQWQKVAVARAMMRETPLVLVLDEPTASLDAATEHALFERFTTEARRAAALTGAITILVSHRFSTVRMADLILVVADGQVVERGTHDELVARGGRYAELYALQARGYR